jgi:Tubulin like
MANANHLLIGLGGTGGKVIRSFRKAVFQHFRGEQPRGANLRYLYIDSSDEMMKHDDPTWRILGQSVQLPLSGQLLISGLNLAGVLDNIGSYPGIAPWIGNRESFRELLNSANAANIVGGQKRHLGRFLFACQVTKFREQLQSLVREMEVGGTSGTTFHVLAGLAGGTGSGCLVDVVCQIRLLYPDKGNRIIVYALLPDRTPPANRAQANYHANGYAALLELNALATGAWRPHDISGIRKDRLELQDPFNNCYLFSDENEERIKVDLDKELPDIAASFLFQRIVGAASIPWDSLRRMETYENMDFRAEESPVSRRAERSRLFCTFGIKQVAYPEEEIREYLTYQFARQAALQLQYNRWSDTLGYLDEPANQSFNELVKQKETLEHWRLTDEHLSLSLGILSDEVKNARWKPVNQFWMDLQPNFQRHVRESFAGEERVWLSELAKLYQQAYGDNYRDLGVRKFYETKRSDCRDHARELRFVIERDLFQDWANGARAMQDVSRLVAALLSSLEERARLYDDRLPKLQDNVRDAEAHAQATDTEWSHVGLLKSVMGKRADLFNEQAQNLTQLYIYRTRVEATAYAKYLLQFVTMELNDLANEVSRAASTIEEATKGFTVGIDARLSDDGQEDLKKQVVRFYKPAAVKDIVRSLTREQSLQAKQTSAVRHSILTLLGDNQTFAAFNSRIPREKFVAALESTCEQNATDAHNTWIAESKDRSRLLGVSVIERLNREYGGNPEALRSYVIGILSHAKNYLRFNPNEEGRRGAGIVGNKLSALTIIMPDSQEVPEFRETLKSEFNQNARIAAKEVITSGGRQSEITLVTLTNLFPARFVEDVSFLRDSYRGRVTGADAEQAKFELHSEGDGSSLPDLFMPEADPKRYLAHLLIARGIGSVQSLEEPDTGVSSLYLMLKDERGLDREPMRLGKDFAEAWANPNAEAEDALAMSVTQALGAEFLHQAKREELMSKVIAEVDAVKAERKNPLDKAVRAYSDAARIADTILQRR